MGYRFPKVKTQENTYFISKKSVEDPAAGGNHRRCDSFENSKFFLQSLAHLLLTGLIKQRQNTLELSSLVFFCVGKNQFFAASVI